MDLTKHQKLACLSQRLPIEFNSTNYVDQEKELQQVEGHVRVCLKANAGFDKLVTVSPSEPILSEAAYFIMSSSKIDIPATLFNTLDGFSVHKGDQGELLGMLLLVIARDKAVGPPMWFSPQKRWCSVPDFLSNLFHQPEKVLAAKGQFVGCAPQESYQLDEELQSTFADSKIYCSHFVKVHQRGCVNASYLMILLARGAGILCANNHPGIDIVIPVLFKGTRLAVDNIGAMSIQIKNDPKYGHKPDLALFKQMDPYQTGIFTEECDIPIIRIVFALAAAIPSLEIVHVPESSSGKNYKTYDIWAAGLSPEIFTPITRQNKDTWDALLDASYSWRDTYKDASCEELELRKMENPGAALEDVYWNNWWDKSAMFKLQ
ncbi:hypothetical protein BDN70DRAFT_888887 [Pholiota conissans]|uniref:Uncharacterized protein n=1 Tax=Pholiota conissans TaxID=109636 RepID=A0A9P5YL95_9AGAR|nr:hypothetical protein BDN70DRAFT_888887 [Pholiota conissans]